MNFRRYSAKHDWETPANIFEPLHAEFRFTLDVCAHARNHKLPRYFSPEQDGLSQSWQGEACWMNPPYGVGIADWVKKAYDESLRGATVVCLLPVSSSTRWWNDYVVHGEIRWIRGRVKFVGATSCAPFSSCVVVFRPGETHCPCTGTCEECGR